MPAWLIRPIRRVPIWRRKLAETTLTLNRDKARLCRDPVLRLFIAGWRSGEAVLDPAQELVANGPVGIEPLLAAALLDGGIGGGPVFDLGRHAACQLEGLMMGFRGQGDNKVEIQSFPVL